MRTPVHLLGLILVAASGLAAAEPPAPVHLDDIHLMVSDEGATVAFLEDKFAACEMAHPDRPIDYVRYLSLRYGSPTLTVTGPTPADEPDILRAGTTGHVNIVPAARTGPARWGVYWVALSTVSIAQALAGIEAGDHDAGQMRVVLPQEPDVPAVTFFGPDNIRFALVERPDDHGSPLGVDHLLLLVSDAGLTAEFFRKLMQARVLRQEAAMAVLEVADARLILAEPEKLGLERSSVQPPAEIPWAKSAGGQLSRVTVPASVEHLGFLFAPGSLDALVTAARAQGYEPEYAPFRYVYRGRPTVFTVTEFKTVDGFGIEAVTADGRIGPHAYYRNPCSAQD